MPEWEFEDFNKLRVGQPGQLPIDGPLVTLIILNWAIDEFRMAGLLYHKYKLLEYACEYDFPQDLALLACWPGNYRQDVFRLQAEDWGHYRDELKAHPDVERMLAK